MKSSFLLYLTCVSGFVASLPDAQACSSCGCSLSSDWGLLGFDQVSGTSFSLRHEYFDQTQLRSGTGTVNRGSLAFPNDNETQLSTTNRHTSFALDQVIDARWSVSVQAPWRDRDHRTIAAGDVDVSTSHANGLGDAQVLARYAAATGLHRNWSLQFGLKLPTGRFDQDFATGPQAGRPLDRGLQLGTGTTDLLAGVAWFGRPLANLGVFAQAQLDLPVAARDGFMPSASLTFNGGLRWLNSSIVTPQLQLNGRVDSREHGVNSDRPNSGGTAAYLSPGLTVEIAPQVGGFAFVQLPIYQRWKGLQLQPHALFITGLTCRW